MRTKALFLSFVALLMSATLSAQTIIKGDMNDDDQVTIADVTSLVNVILGKAPQETINVGGGSPYAVDNSMVVGTWYAPDGTSFEFNADGTTTFPNGVTYEFMPLQGRLLVYDAAKKPVKVIPILKAESEFLLTVDYATNLFTYYTKSNPQSQPTYYWYVGFEDQSSVDTNNIKTSPTEIGWHNFTIGTTSLHVGQVSNDTKVYWFVLVPADSGLVNVRDAGEVLGGYTNSTVVIGTTSYTKITQDTATKKFDYDITK